MNALQFLVEWAIRSSILIACGAVLLGMLRVKDSAIRLAAWTAILAGSLLIPVVSITLPKVAVPVARAFPQVVAEPMTMIDSQITDTPVDVGVAAKTPARRPTDWPRTVLALYICGALSMLFRLVIGLIGSLRILRLSRAIQGKELRESEFVSAPVTLGVLRPRIVLPMNWRDWDSSKLDAVLAHERSHIDRRDPLVQAVSAFYRATLWFSPLSWYLHARIVHLAEEASDDAAVRRSPDPVFYAELLLDFMRSPALRRNLAGVPMARYGSPHDRIDRIRDTTALPRGVTRWSVVAILTFAMPLTYLVASARTENPIPKIAAKVFTPPAPESPRMIAQAAAAPKPKTEAVAAPKPKFEVASIKPCNNDSPGAGGRSGAKNGATTIRIRRNCATAMSLIEGAYIRFADGINHNPMLTSLTKIEGGPSWLTSDEYTIETEAAGSPTAPIMEGPMMQSLLEDRFQLKIHRETRQGPVYELAVAKGGSKLQPAKQGPCVASDFVDAPPPFATFNPPPEMADMQCRFFWNSRKGPNVIVAGRYMTMADLTSYLTRVTGRLVTDKSGTNGPFDFRLTYAPDEMTPDAKAASDDASAANEFAAAPIAAALQEQLGLKLEAAKGDREYLVIDSVSRPTPN